MADGVHDFTVEVPLTPAYTCSLVTINATNIPLEFLLTDGDHQLQTAGVNVGTLQFAPSPVLQASIAMWYNYNSSTNTLTFCSNDLVSPDSPSLTTFPQGTTQYCHQHTYASDTAPCGLNPNWNYCTNAMPGLQELLRQTICAANTTVINAAIAQGYNVIVRSAMPALAPEHAENLASVYRGGKFLELYDRTKAYTAEDTILHIESTFYGEIYLNQSDVYANVIGSTGDPKVAGKSWLQLWLAQFGNVYTCASLNYGGFPCNPQYGLLGGHVILGKTASKVPTGANYVFIMPICSAHNNNDNVYMAPVTTNKGVALHNYQQ